MKYSLSILMLSFSLVGHGAVLKECHTSIDFEGQSLVLEMSVQSIENKITGKLKSFGAGSPMVEQEVPAVIEDFDVRENLPALVLLPELGFGEEVDKDSLNSAETLIAHAIAMSDIDDENTNLSTGVALEKIRSARVYQFIEKDVNIGSTAIIEAFDKNQKSLGSFYGGFLIGACR